MLQFYEESDSGIGIHGRKITSIHAACYFDVGSNAHKWAGYSVNQWRAGILELDIEEAQVRGFNFTDISTIRAIYG